MSCQNDPVRVQIQMQWLNCGRTWKLLYGGSPSKQGNLAKLVEGKEKKPHLKIYCWDWNNRWLSIKFTQFVAEFRKMWKGSSGINNLQSTRSAHLFSYKISVYPWCKRISRIVSTHLHSGQSQRDFKSIYISPFFWREDATTDCICAISPFSQISLSPNGFLSHSQYFFFVKKPASPLF